MICYSYQITGSLSLILQRVRFQACVVQSNKDIGSEQFDVFLNRSFDIPKIILIDGIHLVKSLVKYVERLAFIHLVVCDAQINFIKYGFGPDDAELNDKGIWIQKHRYKFQERFNRMLNKDVPGIPMALQHHTEDENGQR